MQKVILMLATALVAVGVTGARADAVKPALGGYCPVAYVVMNKAVKGKPDIAIDYAGKHYQFVNAKAKSMFAADPGKYLVAYDSYCATAMAMGKKVASDPKLFSRVDGTTYLFSTAKAKKMFDGDPAATIKKADKNWASFEPKTR